MWEEVGDGTGAEVEHETTALGQTPSCEICGRQDRYLSPGRVQVHGGFKEIWTCPECYWRTIGTRLLD